MWDNDSMEDIHPLAFRAARFSYSVIFYPALSRHHNLLRKLYCMHSNMTKEGDLPYYHGLIHATPSIALHVPFWPPFQAI